MNKSIKVNYSEIWADNGEVEGTAILNLKTGVVSNVEYSHTLVNDPIDVNISISISIGGHLQNMPTVIYDVLPLSEKELGVDSQSLQDATFWVERSPENFSFIKEEIDPDIICRKNAAEQRVLKVIQEAQAEMPVCYTEEAYKIVLGNKISDKHIEILKSKKNEKMIPSVLPLSGEVELDSNSPRL